MGTEARLAGHYAQVGLVDRIRDGLRRLGKSEAEVTVEDLAPVDDFHVGGRRATRHLLDQLELTAADRVLDVGCGIGGASRFAAATHGCRVTGVDLTERYVEAGNQLSDWVGLGGRVRLTVGNVLALPLADESIDKAFMLHVGMNIPDKQPLAEEVCRVIAPGGLFGVYDIMRIGDGELDFPVPWASTVEQSALATPDVYAEALGAAGFEVLSVNDRHAFALGFFEKMKVASAGGAGPPPLGLHLLMGPDAPVKYRNMMNNTLNGRIAPFEIVARKPG